MQCLRFSGCRCDPCGTSPRGCRGSGSEYPRAAPPLLALVEFLCPVSCQSELMLACRVGVPPPRTSLPFSDPSVNVVLGHGIRDRKPRSHRTDMKDHSAISTVILYDDGAFYG